MHQLLGALDSYNRRGEAFEEAKEDLVKLIDEYLDLARGRLKARREELARLKRLLLRNREQLREKERELQGLRDQRIDMEAPAEIDEEHEEEQQHQAQRAHEAEVEEELDVDIPTASSKSCVFFSAEPFYQSSDEEPSHRAIRKVRAGGSFEELGFFFLQEPLEMPEEVCWMQSVVVESLLRDGQLARICRVLLIENLKSLKIDCLEASTSTQFVLAQLDKLSKALRPKLQPAAAPLLSGLLDTVQRKLQARLDDPLYVEEDGLTTQIQCLLQTLQSEAIFHLELCAPRLLEPKAPTDRRLSEFERRCVDYSRTWCSPRSSAGSEAMRMRHLRELIKFIPTAGNDPNMPHIISALKANLRILCWVALDWVRRDETMQMQLKGKAAESQELQEYASLIQCVTHFAKTCKWECILEFAEIVRVFRLLIRPVMAGSPSQKAGNQSVKSLLHLARKLVQFIDMPQNVAELSEILSLFKQMLRALNPEENHAATDFSAQIARLCEKLDNLEESALSEVLSENVANVEATKTEHAQLLERIKEKLQTDYPQAEDSTALMLIREASKGSTSPCTYETALALLEERKLKAQTEMSLLPEEVTKEMGAAAEYTLLAFDLEGEGDGCFFAWFGRFSKVDAFEPKAFLKAIYWMSSSQPGQGGLRQMHSAVEARWGPYYLNVGSNPAWQFRMPVPGDRQSLGSQRGGASH